jgi:deferrochelatase/peroxidase EfeB
LRVSRGQTAEQVGAALAALWDVYQGLKVGRVRDLPGETLDSGELTVLVGFGPKAFALERAGRPLPAGLHDDFLFRSPKAEGGGPLLVGSGLRYPDEVRENPATEEIVIQAIAETKLAVDRLVVETWKALHDGADPDTGSAGVELRTFYLGSQRDDRRSWIDFHDGVSNLRSEERPDVIVIDPTAVSDAEWTFGGTYLAFLRLEVDLAAWRALDRREQELLVGRDKLSGCPLVDADETGDPAPRLGCPIGGAPIWATENDPIAEPPDASDPRLRQSHVQRANHHMRPASDPHSRRIFRQGYEFLEWREGAPGFRAGLNFVSFQDTTARVTTMLTQPGWLGSTNFGGDPQRQPSGIDRLLRVYAAGVYLVPPVAAGERFPGSGAFGLSAVPA